jgi:hypothetical protein
VRPIPEPGSRVDDELDFLALVGAPLRDNPPARGDDDAGPV